MKDVNNVETIKTVAITIEDNTAPTLSNVTLQSNNNTFNGNSTWARQGDTVTLSFTSSEKLQNVVVTMKSGTTDVVSSRITSATVSNNTGTQDYSYSYVTAQGDDNGEITFTINYEDLSENPGSPNPVTSAASTCYFDNIVPVIPVLEFTINTSTTNYEVKFKFEESVTGFSKEDVTVASNTGTLGGVSDVTDDLTSSEGGTVWTGKFYPVGGYIVKGDELSLDCTDTTKCVFTDLAGNAVSSTAVSQYPTVKQFVLQKTTQSTTSTVNISLTFDVYASAYNESKWRILDAADVVVYPQNGTLDPVSFNDGTNAVSYTHLRAHET